MLYINSEDVTDTRVQWGRQDEQISDSDTESSYKTLVMSEFFKK